MMMEEGTFVEGKRDSIVKFAFTVVVLVIDHSIPFHCFCWILSSFS